MGNYEHVFQPLKLRNMTLKNRLMFTPFVPCLVDSEGSPTREMLDFMRMQARTGVSNIIVGSIVDPDRMMCCHADVNFLEDKFVPGLSILADEAHKYGAKISYEVCHSGRGWIPSMGPLVKQQSTGENDIPPVESICNCMTREDMDWMKEQFVSTSKRALKAGFDEIFMHVGHNNLMGAFMSPLTNHRTDEYGGSLENRMRFPIEVTKALREAIGPGVPIEVRVSAEERTPNGATMRECITFLSMVEELVDMAHFSMGNVFHYDSRVCTSPMYTMEHKQNVHYSEIAKQVLNIPVVVVGNIWTLQDAEDILAAGQADVVGFCRSLLADPMMIIKSAAGREEDVRPCLKCMDGCGRIFHGLPARCAVNPELGYETEERLLQPAAYSMNVMVIGGGPAGMQAAQTLCQRGHKVTLYEKSDRLGGLLHDAGAVSFKNLLRDYLAYMVRATEKCGAKIVLNTEVTRELVERENPDAVFVATGSNYIKPPIAGIDGSNVHMLRDVEHGDVPVGKKLVICGGGLSGVESAVDFARKGHDVTVIDQIPTEKFCISLFDFAYEALFHEVEKSGVKLQGSSKIVSFQDNGVVVERNGAQELLECDDVIIALGLRSENKLAKELYACDPMHTFIIGDASEVKNIRNATRTAYDAVLSMEAFDYR